MKKSPWEIKQQFKQDGGNGVSTILSNSKDRQAPEAHFAPVTLSIEFYRDQLTNQCGIIRVKMNEEVEHGHHERYVLPANDVVMEKDLVTDDITLVNTDTGTSTLVKSNHGKCKVVIQHSPFAIEFLHGDQVMTR